VALALESRQGRILADSGEGYSSEQECLEDISRCIGYEQGQSLQNRER
jgi:hypothetical protein